MRKLVWSQPGVTSRPPDLSCHQEGLCLVLSFLGYSLEEFLNVFPPWAPCSLSLCFISEKQGFWGENNLSFTNAVPMMGMRIYNVEGMIEIICSYSQLVYFCEHYLHITASLVLLITLPPPGICPSSLPVFFFFKTLLISYLLHEVSQTGSVTKFSSKLK